MWRWTSKARLRRFLRSIPQDTPWKLRLLADWFDRRPEEARSGESSVQDDLRSLAREIESLIRKE